MPYREPNTISRTVPNSATYLPCSFVDDNTRADAKFSIPFSLFHVVPRMSGKVKIEGFFSSPGLGRQESLPKKLAARGH